LPTESSHPVNRVLTTEIEAPVSVAASGAMLAFAWIGKDEVSGVNYLQLARSIDAGKNFNDQTLTKANPIWSTLTFVQQPTMYNGAPTFVAVYHEA
jgi:hypothetical protein